MDLKFKKINKTNLNSNCQGITLIALIITIIIMLILATVTYGAINGGLFEYAGESVGKSELYSIIDRLNKVKIIQDNNHLNGTLTEVLGDEYSKYNDVFKIVDGELVYMGDNPKIVGYLFDLGIKESAIENASAICAVLGHDFIPANYLNPKICKRCGYTEGEKLIATAPHPDQENSEDIGIGTDGQLVNLDNWTYVKESGTWHLTGYIGPYSEQGEIEGTVPQVISSINVKSMESTFKNNTNLKVAPDIPATIVRMYDTFYGCSQLIQAPLIPYGVKNMDNTFRGCSNLVTLPDGFRIPDSVLTRQAMSLFYGCTKLKELPDSFKLSSNCTTMYYMFYNCSSLEKIPEGFTVPDSVTELSYTFYGCSSLKELPSSFNIPPRATTCDRMFLNCTKLERLPDNFTIPTTMRNMVYAFQGCSNLEKLPNGFRIPEGVTSTYALFHGCSKLSELPDDFTIPSTVTTADTTFYNCKLLEGDIIILGNPSSANMLFLNTSTSGNGLTVYYTSACTNIDAIRATVTSGAKVTFVELPTSTE